MCDVLISSCDIQVNELISVSNPVLFTIYVSVCAREKVEPV